MKAFRLDEVGSPEKLKLVNVPVPEIDDGGIQEFWGKNSVVNG